MNRVVLIPASQNMFVTFALKKKTRASGQNVGKVLTLFFEAGIRRTT